MPRTALLLLVLAVIAVLQVLPELDLRDTAIQRNTASIIARVRAESPPASMVAIEGPRLARVRTRRVILREGTPVPTHPVNRSLSILFSTLLC